MAKSLHDANPTQAVAALAACMSCSEASLGHRLSAAFALLAFCDQNRNVHTAIRMHDQLLALLSEPTHEHRAAQLQCSLIFNATFGDLNLVPDIAEQLVTIAEQSRRDVAADLMRKAAAGFHRCGALDRSAEILEAGYRIAHEVGLDRLADGIAIRLAGQHFDAGRVTDADEWYQLANSVDPAHRDYYMDFAFASTAAEIAFVRGDVQKLDELAARSARLDVANDNARTRRMAIALRFASAYLRGETLPPDVVVGELTKHQSAGFEVGDISDFEIAVASLLLSAVGSTARGAALITDYLHRIRRCGTPISAPLQKAMATLVA